jgi:hypothetical protein
MSDVQRKNDQKWEYLFDKYKILEHINSQGYFEITSKTINEVREARLMTKFDHRVNLPKIFQKNKLSILPISRTEYTIGFFDTHNDITYNNDEPTPFEFPNNIETIDYTNLYSESAALSCAFNVGILDDLFKDGKTLSTVSGRMSTGQFSFHIKNIRNSTSYPLTIKNSQCEIDGGFETQNYFLLIEAKNISVQDFLIRQLYYPYRLWSQKINKKVIPILMTYSNDIFTFFIFKFQDDNNYNSITLVDQKRYAIGLDNIELDDVNKIFTNLQILEEPVGIPFPQADMFERIVDLLSLLMVRELTKEEITANYEFDMRQTQYYTSACRYLGLVEKFEERSSKEISYRLTTEGKNLFQKRHKPKYLSLMQKILEHKVFSEVFKITVKNGEIPTPEKITEVMKDCDINLSGTTPKRRAQTVYKWVKWIWEQIS